MRRYRRRRREYTPAQEKASKDLHQAEMWLNIVASGISEQLKREVYRADGIRNVIEHVVTDLSAAADRLEAASKAHDEAFAARPCKKKAKA